jgi:uncharacterized protein YndB with AHSA1/START domain
MGHLLSERIDIPARVRQTALPARPGASLARPECRLGSPKEAEMTEPTARVTRTVAATPERVWQALTTPALVRRYFFGADVASDFRPGSPIRWSGEFNGKKYEDKGEVLVADAPRTLSVSHWSPLGGQPDAPESYHVVTFELVPEGAQTRVTLTQSNLTGGVRPSDLEKRQEYEKNWTMVLEGLAKVVAASAS